MLFRSETFTAEEMKVFSGSSPSELVGCHLHKLVQVMHLCKFILSFFSFFFLFFLLHYSEILLFCFQVLGEGLHLTSEYLTLEAKVEFVVSRVAALEAENSKLKKDLITIMNETNIAKEKAKTVSEDLRIEQQLTLENDEKLLAAKEKIKTIAAKAVEAFQQTNEYNTVLFS